jgi:pectinesterase
MHRRRFLGLAAGAGIAVAYPRRPLVVAANGDFPTVQAAIDAVPPGGTIVVRPGVYRGQVIVPAAKSGVRLIGLGRRPADVVIADDGSGTWGTTGSASVTIDGPGFAVSNLTFANLFDEAAHPEITSRQAVAVLTRADQVSFRRVRFLGNQDTLYVNSSAASVIARSYFRDCYVEGDVDFIFGRGTAVFDRCRIHSPIRTASCSPGALSPPTHRPEASSWAGPGTRATIRTPSARPSSASPRSAPTSVRSRGATSGTGRGRMPGSSNIGTTGRAR